MDILWPRNLRESQQVEMPRAEARTVPESSHGLRQLPGNVWSLAAVSFFTDISSEMVFNLLPLFLSSVLGIRTGTIGLIEGLAESTASLLRIVSGWFSDRIGRRKGLTIFGYSLSTIVKPFLYFATNWAAVLGIRFLDRVGKGIRNAPRDALLADSVNERQRGLAFGVQRAGDTAGAMLGLMIALALVWATQAGSLELERVTFQRVALISTIPAALAVSVLAIGVRDTKSESSRSVPRLSMQGFDRRFRRYLLVLVLFNLGNSADAFLILRAQERGLGVLGVLGLLITFNLVYAVLSGPMGSLSDRVGRRWLIGGGWLIYALLYTGFALAVKVWQVWLLFVMYGVYYGTVEGVAKAYVTDIVPPYLRGTAFGLYHAAVGAAVFPASLIAGLLWQGAGSWRGFGPQAPFLLGSALALLATVLFIAWVPSSPNGGGHLEDRSNGGKIANHRSTPISFLDIGESRYV